MFHIPPPTPASQKSEPHSLRQSAAITFLGFQSIYEIAFALFNQWNRQSVFVLIFSPTLIKFLRHDGNCYILGFLLIAGSIFGHVVSLYDDRLQISFV